MKEAITSGKPCVINALVQGGKEVLADPFRKDRFIEMAIPNEN
jgi:sulfoacetaldehyde acetyltransferase